MSRNTFYEYSKLKIYELWIVFRSTLNSNLHIKRNNIKNKKSISFSLKKGFTLIEIIISIIIAAVIGAYILSGKQKSDFTSSVSDFASNLVSMIESGVIDSTVGYANGSGGDCSSSNDYTDISAGRVKDCVGWNYSIGGTKNTTGTDSYFKGANFLRAYTNGQGCKVYFDEDGSDPQIFYMFVDCSALDYDGGSSRYKKYVENRVDFVLRSKLPTIYQDTDRKASSIDDTSSSGSEDDGKIKIKFKK